MPVSGTMSLPAFCMSAPKEGLVRTRSARRKRVPLKQPHGHWSRPSLLKCRAQFKSRQVQQWLLGSLLPRREAYYGRHSRVPSWEWLSTVFAWWLLTDACMTALLLQRRRAPMTPSQAVSLSTSTSAAFGRPLSPGGGRRGVNVIARRWMSDTGKAASEVSFATVFFFRLAISTITWVSIAACVLERSTSGQVRRGKPAYVLSASVRAEGV